MAIRSNRGHQPRVEKKDAHRINNNIRGLQEVRLVGENIEPGVYKLSEALRLADEFELDLVEISPNAEPPVCKIMDYKKFVYEQKKRDKILKAKSTQVTIKEIRFGPQTDEHDYEFKKKNAEKFLKEGSKLKAFVFFKGRSIIYKDQGQILLLRLAQDLEEYGKVEAMPVLEGKRMIMFIAPKKKK
ncbi:translation initiation factor IF-3 [Flavobacterium sp. SE-1-e]|uniref:Translation initiation factor IF-3 n=1 Tax=Flavobacterium agrisoli TaxID=2793066 RepID=A0A934PLS5_9FLAO|nr:translation initiation factor IF-3 [Flavobacterium agrisoli]